MPGKARPMRIGAVLGILAPLLVLPSQPVNAQSFLQSLFGKDAPSPPRPAGGYVRSQPAPGYSPYAPSSPFAGLFSPFQSQRYDNAPPQDRSTYRTLCVRMCDGFYFPISYATSSANFTRDAEKCAATCGGEARLFYYRNPGGDVEDMLDLTGRAYASYPTAFKYRKTLVKGCQCRPQPWTEAERVRHRGYAAALAPPGEIANLAEPPPSDSSDPARIAGDRHDPLASPPPINRNDLDVADARAPVPPPVASVPARVPPVTEKVQVVMRPNPVPRHAQAGQWNWNSNANGQARSPYNWSGGR